MAEPAGAGAHFPLSDGPGNEAPLGETSGPFCIVKSRLSLGPGSPGRVQNEYRAKGSPWSLQVVDCLRSGAHPSGPGSDNFCFLASCECAVGKFAVGEFAVGEFAVGEFMGLAPAAAAAAAVQ